MPCMLSHAGLHGHCNSYIATYYRNNSFYINAILPYHLLNSVDLIIFYGIPDAYALPLYSNRVNTIKITSV